MTPSVLREPGRSPEPEVARPPFEKGGQHSEKKAVDYAPVVRLLPNLSRWQTIARMAVDNSVSWIEAGLGAFFALYGGLMLSTRKIRVYTKSWAPILVCGGFALAVWGVDKARGWSGADAAAALVFIAIACIIGLIFAFRLAVK